MRSALLLLAIGIGVGSTQEPATEQFTSAVYVDAAGVRLPYRLLQPESLVRGRKYPLVVQLHGSGAIGTDNRAQIGAFSNGWLLPEMRRTYAAFVLVPQFPSRTVEYPDVSDPLRLRSKPLPPLATALQLVEKIARDFPVDRSRIYLTGFSMGASSALQAVMLRPDLFAAAVAIAPVPPDTALVPKRPILILHGEADTENPFATSRAWSESMKKRGAVLEFRSYPGLQHELPPDVPAATWWRQWLFAKRLNGV